MEVLCSPAALFGITQCKPSASVSIAKGITHAAGSWQCARSHWRCQAGTPAQKQIVSIDWQARPPADGILPDGSVVMTVKKHKQLHVPARFTRHLLDLQPGQTTPPQITFLLDGSQRLTVRCIAQCCVHWLLCRGPVLMLDAVLAHDVSLWQGHHCSACCRRSGMHHAVVMLATKQGQTLHSCCPPDVLALAGNNGAARGHDSSTHGLLCRGPRDVPEAGRPGRRRHPHQQTRQIRSGDPGTPLSCPL